MGATRPGTQRRACGWRQPASTRRPCCGRRVPSVWRQPVIRHANPNLVQTLSATASIQPDGRRYRPSSGQSLRKVRARRGHAERKHRTGTPFQSGALARMPADAQPRAGRAGRRTAGRGMRGTVRVGGVQRVRQQSGSTAAGRTAYARPQARRSRPPAASTAATDTKRKLDLVRSGGTQARSRPPGGPSRQRRTGAARGARRPWTGRAPLPDSAPSRTSVRAERRRGVVGVRTRPTDDHGARRRAEVPAARPARPDQLGARDRLGIVPGGRVTGCHGTNRPRTAAHQGGKSGTRAEHSGTPSRASGLSRA